MKHSLRLLVAVVLAAFTFNLAGCKEKDPMEKAADSVKEAADSTADAAKDAAKKVEDAVKK